MFLNKMGDFVVCVGKLWKFENGRYGVFCCLFFCGVEYGLINCFVEVFLLNYLF